MKKSILMKTWEVQAVLDNRKTTTRRIIKYNKGSTPLSMGRDKFYKVVETLNGLLGPWAGFYCDRDVFTYEGKQEIDAVYFKQPYQVGDILWVKETWCRLQELDGNENFIDGTERYYYRAGDCPSFESFLKQDGTYSENVPWRSSIHMPREAARIWLKVTDVRFERLQDITEEDARLEGINKSPFTNPTMRFANKEMQDKNMSEPTYINGFKEMWFDALPKYYPASITWQGNPWVWAITFERTVKK